MITVISLILFYWLMDKYFFSIQKNKTKELQEKYEQLSYLFRSGANARLLDKIETQSAILTARLKSIPKQDIDSLISASVAKTRELEESQKKVLVLEDLLSDCLKKEQIEKRRQDDDDRRRRDSYSSSSSSYSSSSSSDYSGGGGSFSGGGASGSW